MPSAAILWLVAVGTVVVAGSVVWADGFAAVLTGEAVPFRYEVRDSSTEGKGLVALSYADGTMADVAYLPSGACVSSEASVLASDWRRWLTDDHSIDWLNAPTGQLVVSSATLRAESSR